MNLIIPNFTSIFEIFWNTVWFVLFHYYLNSFLMYSDCKGWYFHDIVFMKCKNMAFSNKSYSNEVKENLKWIYNQNKIKSDQNKSALKKTSIVMKTRQNVTQVQEKQSKTIKKADKIRSVAKCRLTMGYLLTVVFYVTCCLGNPQDNPHKKRHMSFHFGRLNRWILLMVCFQKISQFSLAPSATIKSNVLNKNAVSKSKMENCPC